jgi:ABC-type dipeptide/oligopeptide/nickel transport system permease subunit
MATAVATVEPIPARRTGPWRVVFDNAQVRAGLVVVAVLVLVAALAGLLSPHAPDTQYVDGLDADGMPLPPSWRFPLGTDNLGRDGLSRLLYGARVSLVVGVSAVLTSALVGVAVGVVAGYSYRWLDVALMRVTDVFLALPPLLLAIALAGVLTGKTVTLFDLPLYGPVELTLERGVVSLVFIIAVVNWTAMARVIRAQTLSLKEREYIVAARAIGCSPFRIVWRHLLPNLLPSVVVLATLSTAGVIALEVGLSYLGIGVQAPTPSWGQMIRDGQAYLIVAPWLAVPPGVAIVATVFGFNLLGQGLQQVLDPQQKRRG